MTRITLGRPHALWVMTLATLALAALSSVASAHLMVAQKGTLKLGKGGYYFVVSLPVSAFSGVDDDADGSLNKRELKAHDAALKAAIVEGFTLKSVSKGPLPIEGLLLQMGHTHSKRRAKHIIAMGRFNVDAEVRDLTLETGLFGTGKRASRLTIAFTRGNDKERAILTPEAPSHRLFDWPQERR